MVVFFPIEVQVNFRHHMKTYPTRKFNMMYSKVVAYVEGGDEELGQHGAVAEGALAVYCAQVPLQRFVREDWVAQSEEDLERETQK